MASDVFFDNPPALQGTEKVQLDQLYRYLNAMSEKLNQALMNISIEQLTPDVQDVISGAQKGEQQAKEVNGLKSLIIKTAEIVRHEMDEIRISLEDHYEALSSQFGQYERDIDSQITLGAQGVLQDFQIEERINSVTDEFESYRQNVNSYIFLGILDNGKTGIAIGENVTDASGNYDSAQKMATFTSERLSFWRNGIELAYFSDDVFHIAKGEITKELKMGNHTWKIMSDGSMGLISGQTET